MHCWPRLTSTGDEAGTPWWPPTSGSAPRRRRASWPEPDARCGRELERAGVREGEVGCRRRRRGAGPAPPGTPEGRGCRRHHHRRVFGHRGLGARAQLAAGRAPFDPVGRPTGRPGTGLRSRGSAPISITQPAPAAGGSAGGRSPAVGAPAHVGARPRSVRQPLSAPRVRPHRNRCELSPVWFLRRRPFPPACLQSQPRRCRR